MTDKQIIIDGKECRYWFRPNPDDYRKCSLRGKNDNCDEIKDCFVKELLGKLAIKEQECEEINLKNERLVAEKYTMNEEILKLKQTLTEIKEIAEENIRIADLEGLNGVYRRGLAKQILQKISEVHND